MNDRSFFVLAGIACAASSAFAQQKPGDPHADKSSYVPRPPSTALEATVNGPLNVVSPLPPGSGVPTTTNFSSAVVLAVNDFTTVTDTIAVSGVGTYLFDVDVITNITHTYMNDLEVTVTSPSGKRVTLAGYSGGANDDGYNGTIWDDTSLNATSTYLFSGVGAPDLAPSGTFSSLIGENPNGNWKISIKDDAGADTGQSSGWTIKITTLSFGTAQTPGAPTAYTHSGLAMPIVDFNTVSDTITASGLGNNIAEIRVTTRITHTYAGDIDCRLLSPGGTEVTLTNLNGAGVDDVFNGTVWFDDARTGLLDDAPGNYVYTNLVTAPQLTPDGNFTSLWGQNPNGVWTLSVYDNAGADSGVFDGWSLSIRTWGAGAPVTYCTSGTTTHGCLASINANNNPSVSGAVPCVVTVSNVEGLKNGIIFYGLTSVAVPWGIGSNSTLCVKAPTQRTGTQSSGGTANLCDGSMTLNWNAYMAANVALGEPWAVGNKAYVQGWFRDPPAVKTTNLSNGVELTYQP